MYVDSVYAKTFSEVAKLVSPMTTVPTSGCLSFQYQQSEEGGHLFSVFTRDRLGQYQELWRAETENQSDWSMMLGEWIPVQVDLKAPYSVQVSMNMTCQPYENDILMHLNNMIFIKRILRESNLSHNTEAVQRAPEWKETKVQ